MASAVDASGLVDDGCCGHFDESNDVYVCAQTYQGGCTDCRFRKWVGLTCEEIMGLEEIDDE